MTLDESLIMIHQKKLHRKQQWLLEYWTNKQLETEMLFFQKLVAEYLGTFLIGQNLNQSDSLSMILGQWETVNRNEHSWIAGAIEKAAKKFPNFGLNLKLFHYRTSESEYNSIRI